MITNISNKIKKQIFASIDKKIIDSILHHFYYTPLFEKVKDKKTTSLQSLGILSPLEKDSKILNLLLEYCPEAQYIEETKDFQNIYQEIIVSIIEWSFYETYELLVKNNHKITDNSIDDIKSFINEVKDYCVEKLESMEEDSLYNLVTNHLNIVSEEFLQQSFDFLHGIFEEKKRQARYNKLIENHATPSMTARNKAVKKSVNEFCKSLSLRDIEIIDEYYPMSQSLREFKWLDSNVYEEKLNVVESTKSILSHIIPSSELSFDESEIMIFKLVRPLVKEIFKIPGAKKVIVLVDDLQTVFELDMYNRVIGGNHLKHVYMIEHLYSGLKSQGSVVVQQSVSDTKTNIYGAILHYKNYAGLSSQQLLEACSEDMQGNFKSWKISSDENFGRIIRG